MRPIFAATYSKPMCRQTNQQMNALLVVLLGLKDFITLSSLLVLTNVYFHMHVSTDCNVIEMSKVIL